MRLWYWFYDNFFLWPCPFCEKNCIPYWHKCKALKQLPDADKVRRITAKVRDILADEPADRFVHEAHELMDNLEEKFREKPER
jgi:hypothetical protein